MKKAAPQSRSIGKALLSWISVAALCLFTGIFAPAGFAQSGGARGASAGASHGSAAHAGMGGGTRAGAGFAHINVQTGMTSGGASRTSRFYGTSSAGAQAMPGRISASLPSAPAGWRSSAGFTRRVFLTSSPSTSSSDRSQSQAGVRVFAGESRTAGQPLMIRDSESGAQARPFAARNYLWADPPHAARVLTVQQRPRTAAPPPQQRPVYTPPPRPVAPPPRAAMPPRPAQIPQRPIYMPPPRPVTPPVAGMPRPAGVPQAPRPIQPPRAVFVPPSATSATRTPPARPITPILPAQPRTLRFPQHLPIAPRIVNPVRAFPAPAMHQRLEISPVTPFAHVVLPGVPRVQRRLPFAGVTPGVLNRSGVRAGISRPAFPCFNTFTRCGLGPSISGAPFGSSLVFGGFGFGFDGFGFGFGFPLIPGCFTNGFGFTECIFPPSAFLPAGFFPFGAFPPFGFFNGFAPFGFFGNGFFYSPPEPPSPPPVNPTEENPPVNLQNYSGQYLYMPAPQPPPVPYSEPQAGTAQQPVVDLVLKDGIVFGVTAYWLENNRVNYITTYGVQNSIPLEQLDLQKTVDMNYKRGVPFSLTPEPPQPQPPPQL